MPEADRTARNRRTVDLMSGVIAEIGLLSTLIVWSWHGSAAEHAAFGFAASVAVVVASVLLMAIAMVIRVRAHRANSGTLLAAAIAMWSVVASLGVMVVMTLASVDAGLWLQLVWCGAAAAVLAVGLTRVGIGRGVRTPSGGLPDA